jgi:5-formyltetrahydrofolate cyclo-ligase
VENHPEKKWLVPRIHSEGHMLLHPYVADRLTRHKFGMLEPDPTLPVVPAEHVELVLVPGLAYDIHGWRLGYGGGYYDRFFQGQTTCWRLGVLYRPLLQGNLPHVEHDVQVHYLVTEDGVESLLYSTHG